jgi:hypothetical protein
MPSSHVVPSTTSVLAQPVAASQPSVVQGLLSSHESGVPTAHKPS